MSPLELLTFVLFSKLSARASACPPSIVSCSIALSLSMTCTEMSCINEVWCLVWSMHCYYQLTRSTPSSGFCARILMTTCIRACFSICKRICSLSFSEVCEICMYLDYALPYALHLSGRMLNHLLRPLTFSIISTMYTSEGFLLSRCSMTVSKYIWARGWFIIPSCMQV